MPQPRSNFIRQIREKLEKYPFYDGFTIIRELLQNADDADATHVDILYVHRDNFSREAGLNNALLIHSDAIIVSNNGKFTGKNANALEFLNETSKEDDPGSIGKFGLGLKSIFHICEAYYFRGWVEEEPQGKLRSYFVNPRYGEQNFEAWEDESNPFHKAAEDFLLNNLCSFSQRFAGSCQHTNTARNAHFALWIPVRNKEVIGEANALRPLDAQTSPAIYINDFKEILPKGLQADTKRNIEDIRQDIRISLPFLSSIRKITFRELAKDKEMKDYRTYSISESESGKPYRTGWKDKKEDKRQYFADQSSPQLFQGITTAKAIHPNATIHTLTYYGLEKVVWEDQNVCKHIGILFLCAPAQRESGTLTIIHSVYLPMPGKNSTSTDQKIVRETKAPYDIILNVHGRFELDSGRDWWKEDKEDNQDLYRENLKHLLPALHSYVLSSFSHHQHKIDLLKTFKETNLWSSKGTDICKDYYLLECVKNEDLVIHHTYQLLKRANDDHIFILPFTKEWIQKYEQDIALAIGQESLREYCFLSSDHNSLTNSDNFKSSLRSIPNARLIPVRHNNQKSLQWMTWNEVQEKKQTSLFVLDSDTHSELSSTIETVCTLFPSLQIYIVDKTIESAIRGTGIPIPSVANIAQAIVKQQPELQKNFVNERKKLIKLLLLSEEFRIKHPAVIKLTRYLLHATHEHCEDMETKLYRDIRGSGNIQAKLWGQIFALIGQDWQIISEEFLNLFNHDQKVALNIIEDTSGLPHLLQRYEKVLPEIDFQEYSDDERKVLMRYETYQRDIKLDEYKRLVRSMSIFKESFTDELIAIPHDIASVYWNENNYLPEIIGDRYVILKRMPEDFGMRPDENRLVTNQLTKDHIYALCANCSEEDLKNHSVYQTIIDYIKQNLNSLLAHKERNFNGVIHIGTAIKQLQRKAWLPQRDGGYISPSDIVYLPLIKGLEEIIPSCTTIEILHDDIRQDKQLIDSISKILFNTVEDSFDLLKRSIESDGIDRNIGIDITEEETVTHVLRIATQNNFPQYLGHFVKFIRVVFETNDEDYKSLFLEKIAPLFSHPCKDVGRVKETMRVLFAKRSGRLDSYLLVYNNILKNNSSTIKNNLQTIFDETVVLPTQDQETWKTARQLCRADNQNVDKRFVLHKDILDDIFDFNTEDGREEIIHDQQMPTEESEGTIHEVRVFFEQLCNRGLSTYAIGFTLGLWGAPYKDLAQEFLGDPIQYNIDTIIPNREKIPISSMRVSMHETGGDEQVHVSNLFGDKLLVPQSKEYESYFIGTMKRDMQGRADLTLDKRILNATLVPAEKLAVIFTKSLDKFLERCFITRPEIKGPIKDEFERYLENQDEITVEPLRKLLLREMPAKLLTMPLNEDALKPLKRIADDIRSNLLKQEISSSQADQQKMEELYRALEYEIEKNSWEIAQCIAGEREREGYSQDRVLFELFQNADDAIQQYYGLRRQMPNDTSFSVECRNDSNHKEVFVRHYGRDINEWKYGSEECIEWKSDLDKMVQIKGTGKHDSDKKITGQFGVGFKSVWIVAERVFILSGGLRCRISAALYPQVMSGEEIERYSQRFSTETPGDRKGTLFVLSCRRDLLDESKFLGTFQKHIPYLLLCTAHITNIKFNDQVYALSIDKENPIKSGEICIEQQTNKKFLRLATSKHDARIVFEIERGRIQSIEKDTPTIWVKAPTHVQEVTGYIVHGDFKIDVGRTSLQTSESAREHNSKVFQTLHEVLCRFIEDFSSANEEEKEVFIKKIAPNERFDTAVYSFWDSFFQLFKKVPEVHHLEIRHIYEHKKQTIVGTLWENNLLANGIEEYVRDGDNNPMRKLIGSATQSLSILSDEMYKDINYSSQKGKVTLNGKERWNVMKEHGLEIPQGNYIANNVAEILRKNVRDVQLGTHSIAESINTLLQPDNLLTVERCHHLHIVLSDLFRDYLETEKRELYDNIKDTLKSVKVKVESNDFIDLQQCLLPYPTENIAKNEDALYEYYEAHFAPDNMVVSSQYAEDSGNNIKFLRFSRIRKPVIEDHTIAWITSITTEDTSRQEAVLRYLLLLRQNNEIVRQISNDQCNPQWLALIKNQGEKHPILQVFDEDDRSKLCRILEVELRRLRRESSLKDDQEWEHIEWEVPEPERPIDYRKFSEWWEKNYLVHVEDYKYKVYPYFWKPDVLRGRNDDNDTRLAWFTLISMGILCSAPWMNADNGFRGYKTNKDFLERIENGCHGLSKLSKYNEDGTEKSYGTWVEIIEHLESVINEGERSSRMRFVLYMFIVSKNLSQWIPVLQKAVMQQVDAGTINILQAIPFHRLLGEKGRSFVIREIVRHCYPGSTHRYRESYFPNQYNKLEEGGVEDKTLNNCFSIAFHYTKMYKDWVD